MARDPLEFDPEEKTLSELGGLKDLFARNTNQAVAADRAEGGSPGMMDDFAREQADKLHATQSELLGRLDDIHESRSERSQALDESLEAPVPDDPQVWADDPSQWDWPGIDTPRR